MRYSYLPRSMRRFASHVLAASHRERTLVVVKPDGVQRALVGDIVGRFERRGFKLGGLKLLNPSRALAEAHYVEHSERPFFSRACRFLCSGPAVAMVWEGLDVVATSRRMIGTTQPSESAPGTIRGDLGQHFRRNVVHGSDSVESADREVALWFDDDELVSWNQDLANWVLELPNAPVEFGADEDPVHPGSLDSKEGGAVNDELPYGHSA